MTATRILCDFLLDTNYGDIPTKVVEIAKERILDTIGVMLAGAIEPGGAGEISVKLIKELGGTQTSTVIGGGFKTSAPNAALANGTSAATLEYDDASTHTVCHYSGALIPAALATAEMTKAFGSELLSSYILAWEIGTRIGACLGGTYFFEKGFHPVGTWPCLGTAAAAAKLLGCNLEQTRMAMGIAASSAGSIRRAYGTHTKPLHSGYAARNGIIAAMLAKNGFTAHKDILDPDPQAPSQSHMSFSFPIVFSGEGNYDFNKLTKDLGNSYNLETQPVTTHFYPAATATGAFIELAINMMKKESFSANDVKSVEVKATHDWIDGMSPFLSPATPDQAKFSGNYLIAVAMLDGKVGIEQVREARINSPDVKRMMQRVHILETKASRDVTTRIRKTGNVTDSGIGELTITLQDGRAFTEKGDQPKGSGQLPLKRQDLIDKYRYCSKRVMPPVNVQRSIELIDNMENIRNINELMSLLEGKG
jgi:2-methylcitrate dehydratase PrpD